MVEQEDVILEVEHLAVDRDGDMLIRDLSFSVATGEVFVILGPNGAGKTTLLRALLNLIPHRGRVNWRTRAISYLPPQELLQRRELPPITLADFFGLKTRDADAIRRRFIDVGLDASLCQRPFGTLSTGQFQRMLLAWALVNEPDVLLLDEPTAGIDVGGEETIYSLLERFRHRKPLTILLVTHDLHVVWELATTVLCLNGLQLCMGAPRSVLTPEQLQTLYGTGVKLYEHRHG